MPRAKQVMFNLFCRGQQMSEIENQTFAGLMFWNECHNLMTEAEKMQ
jgi:hypothetical protein